MVGRPRLHTIIARERTALLCMSADTFNELSGVAHMGAEPAEAMAATLQKAVNLRTAEEQLALAAALRSNPFFAQMPTDLMNKLGSAVKYLQLEGDQVLLKQGEKDRERFRFFVIVSGVVACHHKENSDEVESLDVATLTSMSHRQVESALGPEVALLHDGDAFGEQALRGVSHDGLAQAEPTQEFSFMTIDRAEVLMLDARLYDQILLRNKQLSCQPQLLLAIAGKPRHERSAIEVQFALNNMMGMHFFQQFPRSIVGKMASMVSCTVFEKDQEIYREGDPASIFYFVWRGKVDMFQRRSTDALHRESLVNGAAGPAQTAHVASSDGGGSPRNTRKHSSMLGNRATISVRRVLTNACDAGDGFGEVAFNRGGAARYSENAVCSKAAAVLMFVVTQCSDVVLEHMSGRTVIHSPSRMRITLATAGDARSDEEIAALTKLLSPIAFIQQNLQGSPTKLAALARAIKYQSMLAGEIVFQEGDSGSRFYIILSGSVGIWIQAQKDSPVAKETGSMDKDDARERERLKGRMRVRVMHPGEAFGEVALLHECTRMATVIAEEYVEFLTLDKADYMEIIMKEQRAQITAIAAEVRIATRRAACNT